MTKFCKLGTQFGGRSIVEAFSSGDPFQRQTKSIFVQGG